MKKPFSLIVWISAVILAVSCKKKACPKPEVWGVGTWKLTEFYDNGVLQNPSDPEIACKLNTTIQLDDDNQGTWTFYSYGSSCTPNVRHVVAWAENIETKRLMVTIHTLGSDSGVNFVYVNKDKITNETGRYKTVYEKQ